MGSTLVIAECSTSSEKVEDLLALLRLLADASLTEPGCLSYEVYQSINQPESFVSIETYADGAAFQSHRSAEHFKRIGVQQIIPLLDTRNVRELSS